MVGLTLGPDWPERDFACTAFDVDSGAFVAWDAASGAPFDRAVTSSCAVPALFPPITIGGRRYMDGGVISGTNSGLGGGPRQGGDRVGHLAGGAGGRGVPAGTARPRDQRAAGAGAEVELLEFDDATQAAAGGDLMSFTPAVVDAVGAAGLAQGRAEAERIGALWG